MWFLPIHDYGRTRTEACSSDHHSLRITLQFTMFYFFKDFGLFAICSVLFSASPPLTTLPPIVPRSQVLMHSSFQETRNSVASRYELLNSAVIARSLSFSFLANLACVSASVSYVIYVSAICFQSTIPTSSFSTINPTASMHSSSTPATSSHSTVHLESRPTITPQSTSQGLILGISLMFAVFILLLPLVLYSLSRCLQYMYQPPTRNQDTITHIPLQQFPASEPTPSLPSPPPPPLPAKNKDMHIYENTKGMTRYAVSDLV